MDQYCYSIDYNFGKISITFQSTLKCPIIAKLHAPLFALVTACGQTKTNHSFLRMSIIIPESTTQWNRQSFAMDMDCTDMGTSKKISIIC